MKHLLLATCILFFVNSLQAQEIYTMGYKKATITVVDQQFFSTYSYPNREPLCGLYDIPSATFYTCDYRTIRDIKDDYISENNAPCCDVMNFDPSKYYGTFTFQGVIDSVNWDGLTFYVTTDKARLKIETDEKEIDALYKEYYEKNKPGKVHVKMMLKTFDTVNENTLSYNENSKRIRKQKKKFTKILRF
jgi:hypothetical protein